jgi:hypothetical protein
MERIAMLEALIAALREQLGARQADATLVRLTGRLAE